MPRQKKHRLFEVGKATPDRRAERAKHHHEDRLWTGNKARLIQAYLVRFVQVTKHGTYIDGFAGPQRQEVPESWTANLVVGPGGPQLLQHFLLFDIEDGQVRALEELAARFLDRDVRVFPGDFNVRVDEILRPDIIRPRQATFCLLDQRTFECKWPTVQRLSEYKADEEYKIELFYFLPQAWLNRALKTRSQLASREEIRAWWGRDDYGQLKDMTGRARATEMVIRFKDELGYRYASEYEIYQRRGGRRVMYYMIHGTDHHAAPRLMQEAYDEVVRPPVELDQVEFDF